MSIVYYLAIMSIISVHHIITNPIDNKQKKYRVLLPLHSDNTDIMHDIDTETIAAHCDHE